MDKDTYVYCIDCIWGKKATKAMYYSNKNGRLPKQCKTCWPFDMEDSRPFEMRKNYVAKENLC